LDLKFSCTSVLTSEFWLEDDFTSGLVGLVELHGFFDLIKAESLVDVGVQTGLVVSDCVTDKSHFLLFGHWSHVCCQVEALNPLILANKGQRTDAT